MEVDAGEVQIGLAERVPDSLFGLAGLDRETKLLVKHAGGGEQVRAAVNARRDAKQDLLRHALLPRHFVEQVDLVHAVDRDQADAVIQRLFQFYAALVVAVKVNRVRREAGGTDDGELSARHNVNAHALFRQNARQRRGGESFGRVRDVRVRILGLEPAHERPAHGADRVLVVNVKRRAEPGGERYDVTSTDGEMTVRVHPGGHGQQFPIRNLGQKSPFVACPAQGPVTRIKRRPSAGSTRVTGERQDAAPPRVEILTIDGRNGVRAASTLSVRS